jgi:predicted dehydrogenase
MIRLGILSLEHPHAAGNHFPALRYIADRVKVAAIWHPDRAVAQPWLDLFTADYCAEREALLCRDDLDAVLITSRNHEHATDAIAAAEAGKDVCCDKPISTTAADAETLVDTINRTGVRFITTFPVRFNTSVRRLKQAVDAGELGTIRAIMATNHGCMYEPGAPDWVRDPQQNGGGCLIDHTVHVADILRWLTGAEFATVRAEAATALHSMAAEDIGVLHGEMTDGTLYQIDASWSRRDRDPMWGDVTFRVVGTRGAASLDLYNNQRIEIYDRAGTHFQYPNHLVREHAEIFLDYAASKTQGRPSLCADAADGLRTVELVCAAYESVRSSSRVEVRRHRCASSPAPLLKERGDALTPGPSPKIGRGET